MARTKRGGGDMTWLTKVVSFFKMSIQAIGIVAYFASHVLEQIHKEIEFPYEYHQTIFYLLCISILLIFGEQLLPLIRQAIDVYVLWKNNGEKQSLPIREVIAKQILEFVADGKIDTPTAKQLLLTVSNENLIE